jgi:Flp pilus assembly pilin Flp
MQFLKTFWREDEGQDLIEYSLLLGFVALFSTGIYTSLHTSISGIWTGAGTVVNSAVPS